MSMRFFHYFTFAIVITEWSGVGGKITPPKKLGPGETRIHQPGWQHCIHDLKAKWGWQKLKSDGYPKFGGKPVQCTWTIEAPIGWRVMVAFEDLNMVPISGRACRAQYVEIIDLGTGKAQGRFCGNKPPGDYVSSGTLLRIDIHGDKKVRPIFRGFVLRYRFVRQQPGFRDSRIFFVSRTTSPGKANFNNFLSQQQRKLNSKIKLGRRPKGPFIYKSMIPDASSTTTKPDSGWLGNDDSLRFPNQGQKQVKGAKVTARPNKPAQKTKNSNGNRIFAVNQLAPATTSPIDGWVEPNNQDNVHENQRIIYGEDNQPIMKGTDTSPNPSVKPGGASVLSTPYIILIAVGVAAWLLIIMAVIIIKRCYFDKLRKLKAKEKAEKKEKEKRESAMEMESVGTMNRSQGLPGLNRTESSVSRRSVGDVSYRNTPLPPIPHNHMTSLPPTIGQRRRPSNFIEPPERIYSNERAAMTLQPHHHGLRRHHDVNFPKRYPTLPPKKQIDVDEDYCSGDDENGDVTTLKRVFSEWELDEKKKNRRK